MNYRVEHIRQFFTFDHLHEPARSVSARFCAAADAVYGSSDCGRSAVKELYGWLLNDSGRPSNPETEMCMRKMHVALNPGIDMAAQYCDDAERELVLRMLLEAKDCAVRAVLAKPVDAGDDTSPLAQHVAGVVGSLTDDEKAVLDTRMADPARQTSLTDLARERAGRRRG